MRAVLKRYLHPTSIMTALLMALGVFLAFYLRDVYKTEEARLQKEAGYLFGNAIKDIEGSMLSKLVVIRLDSLTAEGSNFPSLDSIRATIDVDISNKQSKMEDSDVDRKIQVIKRSKHRYSTDDRELLLDFESTDDSDAIVLQGDSTFKGVFIKKIINQFEENLKDADLEIKYSFTAQDSLDLTNPISWLRQRGSADTLIQSGLQFDNNKTTILKNTLPQFVLVSLLYAGILVAFIYLLKSMAKERQLLEMKNDFIQNMTHELKTPISTMKVAFEAAHTYRDDNPDRREEYLDIAEDQTNRLSQLVQRVLAIFQVDQEKPIPAIEDVNVNDIIQQTIDTLSIKAQAKKININFSPDALAPISCDPQWLQMIIHNVLDNAIKYNHKSIDGHVTILVEKQKTNLAIRIQDNGPGIAEDQRAYIFEKFFRVSEGNVHNTKGHGLGLYFSQKLVHNLGGDIVYKPIEDGSEFIITIPTHA